MSNESLNPFGEDPDRGPESPGGAAGGAEARRSRAGAEPAAPSPAPPSRAARPRPGPALGRHPTTEAGFTPEQRLLVLDSWRRSGRPAGDFAPLVGVSKHTIYAWQKKFETGGPAGPMDRPKGRRPARGCPG